MLSEPRASAQGKGMSVMRAPAAAETCQASRTEEGCNRCDGVAADPVLDGRSQVIRRGTAKGLRDGTWLAGAMERLIFRFALHIGGALGKGWRGFSVGRPGCLGVRGWRWSHGFEW